ncbi:MAG: hypothetical protein CVV22_03345 [Ignavibacteriae bacterium HGW-Ignavibacteriae-1]|jgi:hypothetical protein|nr:MAG: hypothetical protein CVV22_03345 [Ignavibacteriae bacterium HGW-Ignavibacteriae-1]
MDYTVFIQQLDNLIGIHKTMRQDSQQHDLSDLPKEDRQSLVTRTIAAIHRITGVNSTFSQEIERIIKQDPSLHKHTSSIIGVVKALREDLASGSIQNLAELVHADIFADFLDMAQHLSDSGYKDPAAVLAGSTLESHLKKLAIKNGVPVDIAGKPVKADKLNADLAKLNVYTVLDQKNVTAWLDLRNKAAHGNYNDYNNDQVKLLIAGIHQFIVRIPA